MRSKHWDNSNWRGPLPTELSVSLRFAHWRPSERRVHRPVPELHRSGNEAAWRQRLNSIRFQSRCGSGSTRGPMGSSLGARKTRRRCTPRRPPTCQLKIEPARAAMHPPIPRALLQKMPTGSRAMTSFREMDVTRHKLSFRKPNFLIKRGVRLRKVSGVKAS